MERFDDAVCEPTHLSGVHLPGGSPGCPKRDPVLRQAVGTERAANHAISLLAKPRRQGPMTINALAAEMVMDRTVVIDLAGGGEPLRVSKDNKFVKTLRP
jgi:hypothetical protein